MYTIKFCFGFVAVFFVSACAFAQEGDFYLAFVETGATVGNPTENFNVGDSGTLSVYYSGTVNIDVAYEFSLLASDAGVIEFTSAAVVNPVATETGLRRFNTAISPVIDGLLVSPFTALNLPSLVSLPGIVQGNTFDEGFDLETNSFLVGQADFNVVGAGTVGVDIIELNAAGTVPPFGPFVQDFADGGSATISASVVPEPGFAGLLVVAGVGALLRRRR